MSVTFLCGSQYKTHCTTTSIRTSKTAKKNYCKFSEVIPKKMIYLLSISCSMVLRSQPCSYAVQIRCVTSMISNFVYKPNMAFVWLSEIWELQPDFLFFFCPLLHRKPLHDFRRLGILPMRLVDTFMVHWLFCQTPVPFEVLWCSNRKKVIRVWSDMRMI